MGWLGGRCKQVLPASEVSCDEYCIETVNSSLHERSPAESGGRQSVVLHCKWGLAA